MSKSENLYSAARELIPGGVNSPVRAFTGVGGTPLFIEKADGAYLYDVDGKAYIDYVGSWGPMVLGHNHPAIRNAVIEAAERGLSFGAPTEMEVKMAQLVTELVPTMDMVRMVNSGTEATMSAIRLARGFTGRDKIIKFEGCYHGHADCLLVKAGSGALTLGQPNSPGVPADFAKHTLTCTYNDLASVRAAFEQYPQEIACIIVEPVAGNMNCVPPLPEFLPGLRALCDEFGALLIIDEVMTGFRVALAGAQDYYGVVPDLTCLGKIIGGGPMMGKALASLTQYTRKTDSGVLCLKKSETNTDEPSNCINCGVCARNCPMRLMPMYIESFALSGDYAGAEKYGAMNCIECGLCAYNCPAKRALVQSISSAKAKIKEMKKNGR